jgi:hypothetical protein
VSAGRTKARQAKLGVFVRAHHMVIGFAAEHVVRLVLPNEVRERRPGSPGLVEAGGENYAAWDLGALLGLPLLDAAWVLARLPRPGGMARVALRTGPCVVVTTLPEVTPLPPGAQVSRRAGFVGGFATGAAWGDAAFGLVVDLPRLLGARELDAISAGAHVGAEA